jgi:hypothetical protein
MNTTRARRDAYAQQVSELADDALRAAARAYRAATELLDLEREAAEQRLRDAAPDFPDDPAYDAALQRYFHAPTLHAQTQAAAAAIRRAYPCGAGGGPKSITHRGRGYGCPVQVAERHRLGPSLGRGGMGEVYRATDSYSDVQWRSSCYSGRTEIRWLPSVSTARRAPLRC